MVTDTGGRLFASMANEQFYWAGAIRGVRLTTSGNHENDSSFTVLIVLLTGSCLSLVGDAQPW